MNENEIQRGMMVKRCKLFLKNRQWRIGEIDGEHLIVPETLAIEMMESDQRSECEEERRRYNPAAMGNWQGVRYGVIQ